MPARPVAWRGIPGSSSGCELRVRLIEGIMLQKRGKHSLLALQDVDMPCQRCRERALVTYFQWVGWRMLELVNRLVEMVDLI